MKQLIALTLFVSFLIPVQGQVKSKEFQKLFDLYAMEDYERCAWKAETYTRKDKYRRSPEPYMYMALCMYQAHINPDNFEEEYKDPIKDALKYAYKFRKKDKEGTLYAQNKRQIDLIREQALDRAKFYFNDEDYYKAASEFGRILKVMPDDVNIVFMTGVAQVLSRNVTQGEKFINQALDTLNLHEAENRFVEDPVTQDVLVKGFITYSNYLKDNGKLEEALELLTLSRKLIPSDPNLKAQYKKIYALAPEEQD